MIVYLQPLKNIIYPSKESENAQSVADFVRVAISDTAKAIALTFGS